MTWAAAAPAGGRTWPHAALIKTGKLAPQAPFRLVRQFVFAALGANAALGTLITLARLVRSA